MQFGFIPGNGTMNTIFIVRRVQEEYRTKDKKLYMRSDEVGHEKGLSEVMVRAVMSLYDGAKTRVTVGYHIHRNSK